MSGTASKAGDLVKFPLHSPNHSLPLAFSNGSSTFISASFSLSDSLQSMSVSKTMDLLPFQPKLHECDHTRRFMELDLLTEGELSRDRN